MMMSIALRFIPTLIEETDKIMSAQRVCGADFESGTCSSVQKPSSLCWSPCLSPPSAVLTSLAVAMECRWLPRRRGPHPPCASCAMPPVTGLCWPFSWRCPPGVGAGRFGLLSTAASVPVSP